MKSPTPLFTALVLGAVAPAQTSGLQIAACETATTPPGEWGSELDEAEFASLLYDELPGETTLLFVHTTISPGGKAAAGVISVYPFLRPPDASWTGSSPELLSPRFWVPNQATQLGIPPDRVRRHILQFLDQPDPSYGTSNQGSSAITRYYGPPSTWPGLANADERKAWAATSWTQAGQEPIFHIFNVTELGRAAVIQAAHYHALPFFEQLNPDALTALNDLMQEQLGFQIFVQAAHVNTAPNPPTIRFSQIAVMRQASLFQVIEPPWFAAMGPQWWVPNVLDPLRWIYFAFKQDEMRIRFPHAVCGLRAWIPTTTGLVSTDQLMDQPTPPDVARFQFPWNAVSGIVYFDDGTAIVPPMFPVDLGAEVWALALPPLGPQ